MRGFTLIELLIVIGILAIVAVFSLPFLQTFQVSSDLNTHTNTLNQALRRAHLQAIAGQNNSNWGVYFDNPAKKFILFKGSDYSTRDQDYDIETEYPEIFNIATDFGNEIYFTQYSGQPSSAGTVTLSGPNNESEDISISNIGLIQIDN